MTNVQRIALDDDLDRLTHAVDEVDEVAIIVTMLRPDGTTRSILRANSMHDLGMLLASVMSQIAGGCEVAATMMGKRTDLPTAIRDAMVNLGVSADHISGPGDLH